MRHHLSTAADAPAQTEVREFVVTDLTAAERFWVPLMAFLGWERADDGIGALLFEGGRTAVLFSAGEVWDQAANELHRVTPFAHLAFGVHSLDELHSLAGSLETRAGVHTRGPRPIREGDRWLYALTFRDPNGLDVEVRCPAA